jgi:hypothetical protein
MPQDEISQQGNADASDDIANLPEIRRIQDESGAWYYNVTDGCSPSRRWIIRTFLLLA